jgi:hypothetical protein
VLYSVYSWALEREKVVVVLTNISDEEFLKKSCSKMKHSRISTGRYSPVQFLLLNKIGELEFFCADTRWRHVQNMPNIKQTSI